MSIGISVHGNTAKLTPPNRFDAQLHHEFKSAYEPLLANAEIKTIEVDLSNVSYLDSGALGLLVLLDSSANNRRKTVSIISVPGPVAKVLKLANVDKLFPIKLPSGVKLDL